MGNYIIEEEVNNYQKNKSNSHNSHKNWIIMGIIVLIVIVFTIVFFSKKKDSFSVIEEKMVEKAREYAFDHAIQNDREQYFDVSKLNVDLPENCSLLSGVIYNGEDFTPYLYCHGYESKVVNNDETNYRLNGNDIVFLLKGMEYLELGYTGNDMSISGHIEDEEGVYNVYYIAKDNHVLIRKVIVLDNQYLINYFPKMNMTSDNFIVVSKNSSLPLPTAIDTIDGDISNNIVYYSDIDLSKTGEYKVIYSVRNSLGYETSIIKTVVVLDNVNDYNNLQINATLSTENMTNQNVLADISIIGNGYDYTLLPDKTVTNLSNFTYEFSENGEYEFIAFSKLGVENRKTIVIKNIDRTIPIGACNATLYSNKTVVSVKMTSFNYIVGYNYLFNGKESGYHRESYYTINESSSDVMVSVKDYIGNSTTLNCKVEIGDPTVGNPNVKYYVYNNKEYVIANTNNNLTMFENTVCNKMAQISDVTNCGSSCASFAFYYAAYLQRGDLTKMNLYKACHYYYTSVAKFTTITNNTKRDALNYIFDEINRGKVLVLQVSGTVTRTTRHFVVAVGYRRNVYHKEDLQEEDLLVIDAWDGCFSDEISYVDRSKRTIFDNSDGYGYRIDAIIN